MTNHGCMAMTLKPKPNHPNGRVQESQYRKKHVKFGQKWGSYLPFPLYQATAWFFKDSWNKVVWSIRNTTLKLWEYTELWNNQSWILHYDTHNLTHWWLCQKRNSNHVATTVFTGFGPGDFFLFAKVPGFGPGDFFLFAKVQTPMRFSAIEEVKEKSKKKKCVSV